MISSPSKADIMVSAVAILRDEAGILSSFVEETATILNQHYANYEVVLIDNGSNDGTEKLARDLLNRHKCIRYLRLTRSVEVETALMAGLDAAIGDYVVTLQPDFDPPAEMISMVEECRGGSDLVQGVDKMCNRVGFVYATCRSVFISLCRRLTGHDLVIGMTGYRAFSRQAVNALVKVRLRRRYFPFIAADIGLNAIAHPFFRISRSGRRLNPSLFRSVRRGLGMLVHNSRSPLRTASGLGFFGSLLSLLYSLYVIMVYLFKSDVMPGWTTLSLMTSGLFALVFLMLALIGEYIGRLVQESSDRPLYHLREEQSSQVMLTDPLRLNVIDRSEDGSSLPERSR